MSGIIKRATINLSKSPEKTSSKKSNLKKISETIETIFKKAKLQKNLNRSSSKHSKKSFKANSKMAREKSEFQTMKQENQSETFSKISEADKRAYSIKSKKSVKSYKYKSFNKERRGMSHLRQKKLEERSNYSLQGGNSRSNSRASIGRSSKFGNKGKSLKNGFSNFLFSSNLLTPKSQVFDKKSKTYQNLGMKNTKTVATFNIHNQRRNNLKNKIYQSTESKDIPRDSKSEKKKITSGESILNKRKFRSRDMLKNRTTKQRESFFSTTSKLHTIAKSKSKEMKHKSVSKLRNHFMKNKSRQLASVKTSNKSKIQNSTPLFIKNGSTKTKSRNMSTSAKKKKMNTMKKYNIINRYKSSDKEIKKEKDREKDIEIKLNSGNESNCSVVEKLTSKKLGSSRILSKLDTAKHKGAYYRLYNKQKEENLKLKDTINTLVDQLAMAKTKFEVIIIFIFNLFRLTNKYY